MLDIQPKNEAEKVVKSNQERFIKARDAIFEANLKRDEQLITTEIFPKLKYAIALTRYCEDVEWFDFELPLLDFGETRLTKEEKNRILNQYYLEEGVLWIYKGKRGEQGKASAIAPIFKQILPISIVFSEVTINQKAKTVQFKLHLIGEVKEADVKDELVQIATVLDEYVQTAFNAKSVKKAIDGCYEKLTGANLVALYEGDLDYYPIAFVEVDELIKGTDFKEKVGLPNDSFKLNVRDYADNSKLIQSIGRKLRKHGYKMEVEMNWSKEDSFRYSRFTVYINATLTSKEMKRPAYVKSEQVQKAFQKKRAEYEQALHQKAVEQNEQLVELIENGFFDENVANRWMNATVMAPKLVTSRFFHKKYGGQESLDFMFCVPFERTLEGLQSFDRKFHVSDGMGKRYLELPNNILTALKTRYPFFKDAKLVGDDFYDFKYRRGTFGTESFYLNDEQLYFGLSVSHGLYYTHKLEIFTFLAQQLGTLPIDDLLENMNFNEQGVSKKIQDYIVAQTNGDTSKCYFKLSLGKTEFAELLTLYKKSPVYEVTKQKFENIEEREIFSYSDYLKKEFLEKKLQEFQSLKLANLFIQALYVHPMYNQLKEELANLNYRLKVEYLHEEKMQVETGRWNVEGGDMNDTVYIHNVQIIVE